jgi:hypothetical protein
MLSYNAAIKISKNGSTYMNSGYLHFSPKKYIFGGEFLLDLLPIKILNYLKNEASPSPPPPPPPAPLFSDEYPNLHRCENT